MDKYNHEIMERGGTDFFKVKTITVNPETLGLLNDNYVYTTIEDFIPEEVAAVDADLDDLTSSPDDQVEEPGVAGVAPGVATLQNDLEISDEDMTEAITRIERNELKSELIALDAENPVSESELNNPEKGPEEESNNNQIEETNGGDDFDWF
jgi:hypothetical protein